MNWVLVLQPDGRFAKYQPDTCEISAYMMEREETFWWLNKKGLSLQEAESLVYNLENDLMGYKDAKGNPISSWQHALGLVEAEHGTKHVKDLLHEMKYFHGFMEITPGMIFKKAFKIIWSMTKILLWPIAKLVKLIFSGLRKRKDRRDNALWNKGISKHVAQR
ncbi:hypothetical protein RYA05_00970 [Pseudomonas syringae pv. actinidiae]|nr:hypothetical protein [Pseudomonas syringae pv. actinidiae]